MMILDIIPPKILQLVGVKFFFVKCRILGEFFQFHPLQSVDELPGKPAPDPQAMESPDHLLVNFAVEVLRRAGHLPCVNASNRPRLALKEVMWKLGLEMGK